MALSLPAALAPDAVVLATAVVCDCVLGDPVYPWHPVRLIGRTLTMFEQWLRAVGLDGYAGGVMLFVAVSVFWVGGISAVLIALYDVGRLPTWLVQVFVVYSLLALGDLMTHGWRVERALQDGDLAAARRALSLLVGRDTQSMTEGECRRATVESLSENLTDGFTSPVFWYVAGGVPGLVLFKVVSTMDSTVGYKTPRYIRFGWCGARLDDAMNFVPARVTWLLVALAALIAPGCSPAKAIRVGWTQHSLLPGPNSGWSEAGVAGAIQSRLVGPISVNGRLVTDAWLGDPGDPPLATAAAFARASAVIVVTAAISSFIGIACLAFT